MHGIGASEQPTESRIGQGKRNAIFGAPVLLLGLDADDIKILKIKVTSSETLHKLRLHIEIKTLYK